MGKKATPSEKIRKEGEMADIALPNSESGSAGASSAGSSAAVRVQPPASAAYAACARGSLIGVAHVSGQATASSVRWCLQRR